MLPQIFCVNINLLANVTHFPFILLFIIFQQLLCIFQDTCVFPWKLAPSDSGPPCWRLPCLQNLTSASEQVV